MARRRGDLFIRLSLDYADHPKIAGLSDAAFRAHVEMILYSRRYLTDGQIAKQIAKRWPEHVLSELQSGAFGEPLLHRDEEGSYWLHDYADMQETKAEVEKKRLVRAEAGRKGGKQKAKQIAKQSASKVSSKNVAETETETETDNRRARATQFPDDFQPRDSHREKASKFGLDLDWQIQKFESHHRAKGSTFKDWGQALHTWLNNAAEFNSNGRPPSQPQSTFDPWASDWSEDDYRKT